MEDMRTKRRVAVIDGNSLMHRAYHAVMAPMNAPDGTPTNAVFGFLNMLVKFIDTMKPDAIICAFDAGKPKFRIEALAQYKAHRPSMDEELRVQFPLIENLLNAMGIPVVKVPGWEGDDILGTVAARDEEQGYMTLLVTGDKDACQLSSELTHIVTTKKGVSDIEIMTPDFVFEKYGVTPEQFPDYLGLMGDSSDNIPGVPGVGAKTAAKLLQQYGSMEELYKHAEELPGKMGEKVRENQELAFLSREIATIVRDLDFELDIDQAVWPSFDPEEVIAAFGNLGIRSNLGKILGYIGTSVQPSRLQLEYKPLVRGENAKSLIEEAIAEDNRIGVFFSEPEHASLFDNGVLMAANTHRGTALFYDEDALRVFTEIVKKGSFACLDVKTDLARIFPRSTSADSCVSEEELLSMDAFDVGLAGYVINSSNGDYSLASLVGQFMNGVLEVVDDDEASCVQCAAAITALVEALSNSLKEDGTFECFTDIDMPLVAVLCVIERTGVNLDVDSLKKIGSEVGQTIESYRSRIVELAGHEFNIDSPKQLAAVLFDEMKIKPLKKTTRGFSTDASVLKELAKNHELPGLILQYREQAKIKSTYIDALPVMRGTDGRVHSSFNEKVTATGRLSSSDPNLQNIPVRTEFGRQIRRCFIPLEKGHVFLSADYSQIELRLLAHLSQDEHLIAAFINGEDFHTETASRVFGVPVGRVTPELRNRAKAVNFGIVYGQQAYGLSQSLDIPFGEAKDMIEAYFEAYPAVRSYLDETVAFAKSHGYAETMFGRKRHISELRSSQVTQRSFGERTAMNHPMQGSAADIIKIAMRRVQERLCEEHLKSKMIIQVHDELDFSVPVEETEKATMLVRDVMENVVELRVPLLVDVEHGTTWADAH